MADVVLSLGCNLGDRAALMRNMAAELSVVLEPPIRLSRLLETEPLGAAGDQPWYFNRLMRGGFRGTPQQLLAACQAVERKLGRSRPEKHAPRTADVDILLFGTALVNEPDLVIPHRRLAERRFCLEGLVEIAPDLTVPGLDKMADALVRGMNAEIRRQCLRIIEEPAEVRHE